MGNWPEEKEIPNQSLTGVVSVFYRIPSENLNFTTWDFIMYLIKERHKELRHFI